jgi:DNA-binding transcriptional regulator YiaG
MSLRFLRVDLSLAHGAMTPDQFRKALRKLGLTPSSKRSAQALGVTVRQCQRWASGENKVPPAIVKLLAALAELQRKG